MAESQTSFLTYKGKPLVRQGNSIYYGNMSDPYVVLLTIASTHEVHGVKIADKVIVQLFDTNPDVNPMEAIIKRADKTGLWAAIDIASVWLERALKQ